MVHLSSRFEEVATKNLFLFVNHLQRKVCGKRNLVEQEITRTHKRTYAHVAHGCNFNGKCRKMNILARERVKVGYSCN